MKIGVVSYPASGYLNPMTALARRLQSRGHEVLCIGVPDTEPIIRAAGLNFISYCDEEFPVRSLGEAYAPCGEDAWTRGGELYMPDDILASRSSSLKASSAKVRIVDHSPS